MDFALILVLLTAFTGVVWAIDSLAFRPARRAAAGSDEEGVQREPQLPLLVDYCASFFPLLLIVLLVRSFLVEPFKIPSGSMIPTLLVGDYILVNKYEYGLRLPVLETEVLPVGRPARGDVVVFRYPLDPATRYIKRVIGLPGDRVSYRDRQLYVNGEVVAMTRVGTYTGPHNAGASLFQEDLLGVEHQVLHIPGRSGLEDDFVVPEGHYYVLGDNRDSSNDSRAWGTVPESHLVGRAFLIWMNWEGLATAPIWERVGEGIE